MTQAASIASGLKVQPGSQRKTTGNDAFASKFSSLSI
jgi:hypothetical protein